MTRPRRTERAGCWAGRVDSDRRMSRAMGTDRDASAARWGVRRGLDAAHLRCANHGLRCAASVASRHATAAEAETDNARVAPGQTAGLQWHAGDVGALLAMLPHRSADQGARTVLRLLASRAAAGCWHARVGAEDKTGADPVPGLPNTVQAGAEWVGATSTGVLTTVQQRAQNAPGRAEAIVRGTVTVSGRLSGLAGTASPRTWSVSESIYFLFRHDVVPTNLAALDLAGVDLFSEPLRAVTRCASGVSNQHQCLVSHGGHAIPPHQHRTTKRMEVLAITHYNIGSQHYLEG